MEHAIKKRRMALLFGRCVRVFTLAAVTAVGTTFAASRTVEVASYDGDTHTFRLSIGAGEGTKNDVKYLFAAFDGADRGADPSSWSRVKYIGTVYASTVTESVSWTLPEEWRLTSGVVRFFLVRPSGARKQEGYYLATYGVGGGYNSPTNHPNGTSFLQWIDTGIKASSDVSITIETSVASTAGTAPFGAAYSFFVFAGSNASNPTYYSFNHSGTMPTTAKYNPSGDDGVHQIRLGKSGMFIDGVCIANAATDSKFSQTFTAANTIWLFGRNRTDVNTTITSSTTDQEVQAMVNNLKLGWCRIWSAQILTNGVPARSFTPRKVGNVPVMWDSVTETAFYNAGGNHDFIYGSQSVVPSDGILETSSTAFVLAPEIEVAGTAGESVTLAVRGDGRGGTLYAVRGATDRGASGSSSDWEESLVIGVVPAGATTYTATLPAAWWKAGGYARFLLAGNAVYDFKLTSLSSTGKGDYWPPSNQNDGINDQGYQYIDTGIVPSNTTTTALRVLFPNRMNMAAFGHAARYYFFMNQNSLWGAFSTVTGTTDQDNSMSATQTEYPNLSVADGGIHEIRFGPDGGFVDGVDWWSTVKGSPPSATAEAMRLTRTMTLFARRDWSTMSKFGACTIYWAKIWNGDTLVRDFVPVEKDGVGYLYDTVTMSLFGNANTGYGTAGTETGAVPFAKGEPVAALAASDVLAVSRSVPLNRGVQIIIR